MTSIETKALCSVLRKAETKGTENLVNVMIDICDAQSGLLMQDLWKWWQNHKLSDAEKHRKALEEIRMRMSQPVVPSPYIIVDPSNIQPIGPTNKISVIC